MAPRYCLMTAVVERADQPVLIGLLVSLATLYRRQLWRGRFGNQHRGGFLTGQDQLIHSQRFWVALAIAAALIALAVAAVWLSRDLTVESFVTTIQSWGMWGVAASVLLMVIHTFIPFPAELLACANGMIWGKYGGTAVTWTGAMLGASLGFALARQFGRPLVDRLVAARHAAKIDRWTEVNGWQALLLSRFMPVIAFNLINFAAGLTKLSWWQFLWTTGLGILPLTFAMAWIGEEMQNMRWEIWVALMFGGITLWLICHIIARTGWGKRLTANQHHHMD